MMSYHKKSTKRVVKRKIDPLRVNGNLLLAFDHKRKALRSFHLDGVKSMEKSAFMEGFAKGVKRLARNNPEATGALGLGAVQAAVGRGMTTDFFLDRDKAFKDSVELKARRAGITLGTKKYKEFLEVEKGKVRKWVPILLAVQGAVTGAVLGNSFRSNYRYQQYGSGATSAQRLRTIGDLQKALSMTGRELTKSEARKKFHQLARKHHPDLGGSNTKMEAINAAWTEIQKTSWFQKLAFITGGSMTPTFWGAFEKKANAAAELAGLGMLAVPSIQHLRGKPLKESTTHKLEIAGLGTLAAPYAWSAGKKLFSKGK